ncbi:MAG TPA: DUF4350 domain-containing protein [Woeseiaceae bacterium]|nr:DUF4350 domain-containing protein [Woeseiaceae bacterium]
MRDRLVTFVGALLALFVVYGLFSGTTAPQQTVTRPTSIEQGDNGYFAVQQWLVGAGVSTYSLRGRFSNLANNAEIPSETGNILVTTLPYSRPMREIESESLLDWIAAGNTVLVLAAINETPDWSLTATPAFFDDLQTITGIRFVALPVESGDPDPASDGAGESIRTTLSQFEDTGTGQEYEIVPRTGHPLMRNIRSMQARSDFRSSVWGTDVDHYELILELATMPETGTAVVWQGQFENGQVITVGSGTLLTNSMIASADNRIFVANLIQQNLGDGATVIFDDLHQGLSNIYDPEAFFSDRRLHYTIYFIVGLWLLYVVGSSNRLLDPQDMSMQVRQTDFVEATAGFIKRRMSDAAVGMWMYQLWFNDLRRQMHLAINGEPVWQELGTLKTLDKRLLAKLERQYRHLTEEKKISLIELHNTIHAARKAIG